MEYTATYIHGENSAGGKITLDATTDDEAIAEIRDFVSQGYRNETTATVELTQGYYQAWNEHGCVVGRRSDV